MTLRFALGGLAACLALLACKPPHVILVVEDPGGFAAEADNIAVGAGPDALEAASLEGQTFPVRLSLTAAAADERELWVEARRGTTVLARGRAQALFDNARSRTFELQLRAPCGPGERVICDDGLFCNGIERCIDTICEPGPVPCPESEHSCVFTRCDEEAGSCELFPNADACGPVLVDGEQRPGFCDIKEGCVAGAPCSSDGECDDGLFCNGQEACVEGRCVASPPPAVTVAPNACVVAGCSESAAAVVEQPITDGTACSVNRDGLLDGACSGGTCVSTTCGDGVVDTLAGERCDDGNDNDLDLCDNTCQPVDFVAERFFGGTLCDGAPLDEAALGMPRGMAVGPDGSIYLADPDHDVVRRILPDNTVVRVAGNHTPAHRFVEDPLAATVHDPTTVIVAGDGTVFFNDRRDPGFVRRLRPDGTLEAFGRIVKGGPVETALAVSALDAPDHFALSPDDSVLYLVRDDNILEVPLTGPDALRVDIVAGDDKGEATLNDPADGVDLGVINDVVARPDGTLLSLHAGSGIINNAVAAMVRQPDDSWRVSRVAGDGSCDPTTPGAPLASPVCAPRELVQGAFGDDYCFVVGRRVYCVDAGGSIVHRVGTNADGRPTDGALPADVDLGDIRALAVEPDGSLLILGERFPGAHLLRVPADLGPVEVLKNSDRHARRCGVGFSSTDANPGRVASLGFTPDGALQTFGEEELFFVDGEGLAQYDGHMKGSRFDRSPSGAYFGVDGQIVCLQEGLGLPAAHVAGGGSDPADDPDNANNVALNNPVELVVVNDDEFLVLEREGQRLRRVSRAPGTLAPWVSVTVAGTGVAVANTPDGPAEQTPLFWPIDFALGPDGTIFIAESEGGRLRRVTNAGGRLETIHTFDNDLAAVTVDREGNVYVADETGRVFLLAAGDGVVAPGAEPVHIAGTGVPGLTTGSAYKASLSAPKDLAVDDDGQLYLALRDQMAVVRLRRVRP